MRNRNYWAAILLAAFGGWFGLQEFYIGNVFRGVLGIIFSWTCIPAIVAFVQILCWLYNGEDEFNRKYNN